MKTYTRIDNNTVLIENDEEIPRVVNIEKHQEKLQFYHNQKANFENKINDIQDEIAQIENALNN